MNTSMSLEAFLKSEEGASILTRSEDETALLGRELAKRAPAGSVFCLTGDLGSGKTALAKGFAAGLGVEGPVLSPTFTLVREYKSQPPLFHFDLYRLEGEDALFDIGFDEYLEKDGICLIEWADLYAEEMPRGAIWLHLERQSGKEGAASAEERIITKERRG